MVRIISYSLIFFILSSSIIFAQLDSTSKNILNIKLVKFKPRDIYKIKLIKLFLNKADAKYRISHLNFQITKPREFEEIKTGRLVNVGTFTSTKKYEKALIPIRYPIYRGLIGYRIFIINKSKQNLFNKHTSIQKLKKLVSAQGLSWSDYDILKYNGFNVYQVCYRNIFRMLNLNHGIDFFPRGVYEIFFEMDRYAKQFQNLIIEKHLLIHYPLGMYLYVSPKTPEIAKALNRGLNLSLQDGSLAKLLQGKIIGDYTIKEVLQKAKLKNRKIFNLTNPFLTKETKQLLSTYWINPLK